MIYFKLILVIFVIFSFPIKANEVQIIELHKNKSLDQLVLEKEKKEDDESSLLNNENNNIAEQSDIIETDSNSDNIDDQNVNTENTDEQIVYIEKHFRLSSNYLIIDKIKFQKQF